MAYLSEIEVRIGGNPFKDFLKIQVFRSMYGNSRFEMACRFDAVESTEEFLVEKSKEFLGAQITILTKAREYKDDNEEDAMTFRGIITRISGTRTAMSEGNQILIEGENIEAILKSKPRMRIFFQKTLQAIVEEVLQPYDQGLLQPKIKPRNKQTLDYVVQFEESDLDFLRRLSIRYGEWFFHSGQELIFGEISREEKEFTVGSDISELSFQLRIEPLDFEMTAVNKITHDTYNASSADVNVDNSLNSYGIFAREQSQKLYSEKVVNYYEHLNVEETKLEEELKKAVDLETRKDAVSLSSLNAKGPNPAFNPGAVGNIRALKEKEDGKVDYGKYLITSVSSTFDNTLRFNAEIQGVSVECDLPENSDPHFIKKAFPQAAMVTDNNDPDKMGRIKVMFPWMADSVSTPWIHIQTPYVNESAGVYFIPAVGSQVMVAFEGGDIEKPFCIGNFFDKKRAPDDKWVSNFNEDNAAIYAIRTKKGNTIELHDSEGGEKIHIYDKDKKNQILLDSANGNLKISANGDMSIDVGGKLTISASNIEEKANSEFKVEANDIKMGAQVGMELKGLTLAAEADAQLKISSSGETSVQGALVRIN